MDKYINLHFKDKYVETDILRSSYLKYEDSLNPTAANFISLDDDLELGIVSSQTPEIANAVSSILSRSLEDAKNSKEGYLPNSAVERVQYNIISPYGVSELWGSTGHRFVLSRRIKDDVSEILASILVGRSKDTVFFFTGRYNNLRHSSMKTDVDLNQLDDDKIHKWFDRFAFPDLDVFKPQAYHQVANFVVDKSHRGKGLARLFLNNIVKYYSKDYIDANGLKIEHSQHLLCGRGFWQIGDPPWLTKMQALGFYRRAGAESFFIEHDWAPLPPVNFFGEKVTNDRYNKYFGLPDIYENFTPSDKTNLHLLNRIPEVIKLSQSPNAKLQYFQAMYNFI